MKQGERGGGGGGRGANFGEAGAVLHSAEGWPSGGIWGGLGCVEAAGTLETDAEALTCRPLLPSLETLPTGLSVPNPFIPFALVVKCT